MTPKPPPIDSLMTVKVCQNMTGVDLADPAVMERLGANIRALPTPALRAIANAGLVLAAWAQHSILMTVDRDTLTVACQSAEPGELELPPLPFSSIVIEPERDEIWYVGPSEDKEPNLGVQTLCIQEIDQGREWRGFIIGTDPAGLILGGKETEELLRSKYPLPDNVNMDTMLALDFHLHGDTLEVGETLATGHRSTRKENRHESALGRLIVEAVHFITARGVSLTEIGISRAERRRAAARRYQLPARLYWVTVTDEQITQPRSLSDREYHCRWLVRGHWRHFRDGSRTWIRPYVKGPAGAPWRGRPVYRVVA